MLCPQCQQLANLDILLSTVVDFKPDGLEHRPRPHPHHKNFSAFKVSAEAGCMICSLVCESSHVSVPEGQIYFWLNVCQRDVVMFDAWNESVHSSDTENATPSSASNRDHNSVGFCGIRLSVVEGDPVAKLIPSVFTTRPVADDTSSEECFHIARYWLKTCLENHDHLCQVRDSLPLPTRVVDVGFLDTLFVTLYISKGQYGQWLTLSHCWGDSRPATTTMSNLNSQCAGIMISTLPKTYQDAIMITPKLGYRFLWIDSLCIIQNSLIVWQEESVKMNDIYSNAVLNISADAAAGSTQGIFSCSSRRKEGRSPPRRPHLLPARPSLIDIPVHSPKAGLESTIYASRWYTDGFLNDNPLQKRGWVLQEAVLSHRRLRYTSSGLSWSCTTVPTSCNEARPHEIHNLNERANYITSVYQIPHKPLPHRYVFERDNDERRSQIIQWWYEQINDYVNRQLTFQYDRFPAFSGIAERFSYLTQYQYKAGILVEDFRRGLLWQAVGAVIHADIAPSWSWDVAQGSRNSFYPSIFSHVYAHETYLDDPDEVELVDISVKNLGDSSFGQVVSGSLTLRGLCHPLHELLRTRSFYFCRGWKSWEETRDQNYQLFTNDQSPPLEALRLHMDVMDESNATFWQRRDVHIVRIAMFSSDPDTALGGDYQSKPEPVEATSYLILQEIPGIERFYRRIGIARILGQGIESPGWAMKTVTIL